MQASIVETLDIQFWKSSWNVKETVRGQIVITLEIYADLSRTHHINAMGCHFARRESKKQLKIPFTQQKETKQYNNNSGVDFFV